jgi:hypothetical protein
MGDAKRLGSREEQISQSVAATRARQAAEVAEAEAWWAGLTEAEQAADLATLRERKAAQTRAARLLAMGMTLGQGGFR